MCHRWCLHADAGVRPLVVVEAYEGGDTLTCVQNGLEVSLAVDDLSLEDTVHTLCYGIVSGLVVLSHADFDTVLLQFIRIGVAAVLHASV